MAGVARAREEPEDPRFVILLTGATGLVGSALLRRLLSGGERIRCLVREPRRLGPDRVRVQITLGDLGDPVSVKQAVRGVAAVVHLGATIRDQPGGTIEEVNALGSARLLREAERSGVERFIFFSALGATPFSRTRFFRAKALAERAVLESRLEALVFAPSLIYAPDDPFMTLLTRMSYLPWLPIAGKGQARFQPIWSEDVADCVVAAFDRLPLERRRLELAGPELLSYDEIAKLALEAHGRPRPLLHVPLAGVRSGLRALERVAGSSAFATWEEAELMEEPMKSPRGTGDALSLGVRPKPIREVLGLEPAARAA